MLSQLANSRTDLISFRQNLDMDTMKGQRPTNLQLLICKVSNPYFVTPLLLF